MTTTEDRTVLGRPLTGDTPSASYRSTCEQWGGEKFIELLDAVLACPQAHSVRWRQYTPFFNDGDTCEFNVHEFGVKIVKAEATKEDLEDEEDGNGDGDYGDGYISSYALADWDSSYKKRTVKPGFEDLFPAYEALNEGQGHFRDFLLDSFGDHAMVTATKEGFHLEEYSHD